MANLISPQEAWQRIKQSCRPINSELVPLPQLAGRILAQELVAGEDSPPFDKALMDGYALLQSDFEIGSKLLVTEEVTAGNTPKKTVRSGEAIRIMTGAPVPEGAEQVVPIELVRLEGDQITIQQKPSISSFILPQGASCRKGEPLLQPGTILGSTELGIIAELVTKNEESAEGFSVRVFRRPTVSILATGDELVEPGEILGPGQISNSNEPMLSALMRGFGADPIPLGIARDRLDDLIPKVQKGLQSDVLLLSGGVSAGKKDLTPQSLEACGVRQVFHKIDLRPGKPLWFGVSDCSLVFGLPGNPVSSLACALLFVQAALKWMQGQELTPLQAHLDREFHVSDPRPTYHPGQLQVDRGILRISPIEWIGSSDLRATLKASGLIEFPKGNQTYPRDTLLAFFPWNFSPMLGNLR